MLESIRWWLALEAIALAALPICLAVFRPLPDRGFAFNKAVALLSVSYPFWLLNSARLLPNTVGGVLAAVFIVLAVSSLTLWRSWRDMLGWLRGALRYIITVEAFTLAVFVLVAWYRSYTGQISSGEKRMEFMYLNAVQQASHFPPQDAWLSGHDTTYYYFGYVMTSLVGRVASVPTEYAFNVGFAMFVAGSAAVVFGLAYNLSVAASRSPAAKGSSDPPLGSSSRTGAGMTRGNFGWALAAAGLFLLLGNLVAFLVFASAFGLGDDGFYRGLDVGYLHANEGRTWWFPSEPSA